MQMGFGYADDDTPVPLGHGACIYYFNSRCCGLGMNPELETRTNSCFYSDAKKPTSEEKKTPIRSNLSKQI